MKDNTIKSLFAMACVTALEVIALLQNIDGAFLVTAVAALAGLGGYALAKRTGETDSS